MWQMAIPAATNLAGGLFGSRSAKKAAQQQAAARNAQAAVYEGVGQQIEQGWQDYGQGLFDLADQARGVYSFTPYSVRGPAGGVTMGEDGNVNIDAGPQGQMMTDMGMNFLGEASQFDRMGAQQAYYKNLQAMMQPTRQSQQEAMLRTLQAKGMAGLGSNREGNMLMKGMFQGWADQNLKASQMAMDYGGRELDALINRGVGMFTNAGNLSNQAFNQWVGVQSAAQPFEMAGRGAYMNLQQAGRRSPLEGMLVRGDYMTRGADIRAGGQINYAAARDAANQGMIRGFVNTANSLPWGTMFGGGANVNPVGPSAVGTYMGYAPYQSPF